MFWCPLLGFRVHPRETNPQRLTVTVGRLLGGFGYPERLAQRLQRSVRSARRRLVRLPALKVDHLPSLGLARSSLRQNFLKFPLPTPATLADLHGCLRRRLEWPILILRRPFRQERPELYFLCVCSERARPSTDDPWA